MDIEGVIEVYSYSIIQKLHHDFSEYAWKYICLVILFLQIHFCLHNYNSPKNRKIFRNKSTFLSSSASGSVTLEAAIVLPTFLLAVVSLYGFFTLFNYQNILQNSVNNTAKSIARYSYVMDRIGEIEESKELIENLNMDNDILTNGINTGYAWNKILTKEVKGYTEKSNILGGVSGLNIVSSKVGDESGYNKINIVYQMSFNILGIKKYNIRLSNYCYFRAWIGESIAEKADKNNKIVYITKTGKVYHLSQYCTYIEINLRKVRYGDIYLERNIKGNKYKKCNKCISRNLGEDEYVYVTMKGLKYHISKNCQSIMRDAIPIDISKIGSRELCSRCKKNHNEGK